MMTVSYANGTASFEQQDWLGTERMVTGYTGSVEGTYTSLPFGDGFQVTGSDPDQYHFAGLDYEYKVGTNGGALARFRMYYNTAGRWMSPDLYGGSYDFANPQSFDRYSYVTNNPLSLTDQSGLQSQCGIDPQTGEYTCTVPGWASGGNDPGGLLALLLDLGKWFAHLFGFGGGPKFLGSLQPRPQAPSNLCNAKQAVSFIHAHQPDAATVAQQLHVPTQNVLGLSGIESQWGASNAARFANNFFGLHGGADAPYAINVWYTGGGVAMSAFPSYLASARSFAAQYGSYVNGITDPTSFAKALVRADFNPAKAPLGNPNFVQDTAGTINSTAGRMQCP